MDTATENLYKDYSDKFTKQKNAKSYFSMLNNYKDEISKLDEEIIWEEVEEEEESLEEELVNQSHSL